MLKELRKKGFEIGVHGLKHDGKLFRSRKIFDQRAVKINEYLKKWNTRGFTSPSMHHKPDWLHALNIAYSTSTFDTDPFEPQSDALGSIFPVSIDRNSGGCAASQRPTTIKVNSIGHPAFLAGPSCPVKFFRRKTNEVDLTGASLPEADHYKSNIDRSSRLFSGASQLPSFQASQPPSFQASQPSSIQASQPPGFYLELPYTLSQDHLLFVILQEKSIDIWKRKLDWIAEHGGMALLNTHTDYMRFDGEESCD